MLETEASRARRGRAFMYAIRISVVSIALLLCAPQCRPSPTAKEFADTMVRLCLAGGSTQTVTAGADISVRSFDVHGTAAGQFTLNRSSAEGLTQGLNNALTPVAADQADKVREC